MIPSWVHLNTIDLIRRSDTNRQGGEFRLKREFIALLIIGCILLQGIPAMPYSAEAYCFLSLTAQSSTLYNESSPIAILSDDGFADYSASGNGSTANPYRIEGFRIESDQTCIRIENCTKSFIISNCKLWLRKDGNSVYTDEGYRHAILLKNVTSGTVEDSIIELDQFTTDGRISAVHLENCTFTSVMNVIGRKSTGPFYPYSLNMGEIRGVATYDCTSCNVSDCIFLHFTTGIKLIDSMQCQLANNSIIDETQTGIHLMMSSWNSIINNSIDTYIMGVLLDSGSNNSIFGNCIRSLAEDLAWDAGSNNLWHNNLSMGNGWSNFAGTGVYEIEGPAESVDQYPWICTEIQVDVQDRFGPDIIFYNKPRMTTAAPGLGPITQLLLYAEAVDDTGIDFIAGVYRMEGSTEEVSTQLNKTGADSYLEYAQISPVEPYYVRVYIKYWANDSLGNWRQTPEVLWVIQSYPDLFYTLSENLLLLIGAASVVIVVAAVYLRRRYLDGEQLREMLE
jgi:parallel beta-helix repeat protein